MRVSEVYLFIPCKVGRRRLSEPSIVFRVLEKFVWRTMTIDGGKNNLEKNYWSSRTYRVYSASIPFSMHRQSRKKKTRWASNLFRVLWRIVWSAVSIDGGKNSLKNNYWGGITFCEYSAWNDFLYISKVGRRRLGELQICLECFENLFGELWV